MKRVRKREKRKNAGFSLVEVLLAIVLLGLIAAPILQMFYSSMRLNIRSKKYLAGVDLAQSTMENLSSQTWENSVTTKKAGDGTRIEVTGLQKKYYPVIPEDGIKNNPIEQNVDFAGFKGTNGFKMVLTFDVPTVSSDVNYYTVSATCEVFDRKTNKLIAKESTSILNKY